MYAHNFEIRVSEQEEENPLKAFLLVEGEISRPAYCVNRPVAFCLLSNQSLKSLNTRSNLHIALLQSTLEDFKLPGCAICGRWSGLIATSVLGRKGATMLSNSDLFFFNLEDQLC